MDLKISGFAVKFAGCVGTEAVRGKKKLRIQKYPDTCGRGVLWSNVVSGFQIPNIESRSGPSGPDS